MRRSLLSLWMVTMLFSMACAAEDAPPAKEESAAAPPTSALRVAVDEKDRAVVEAFRGHARALAAKLTAEHFRAVEQPEMLCWVELKQMNMSLVAYELSGDLAHLRDFASALENLRSTLTKGPDGFLGWYGKPIESRRDPARPEATSDDIQTSFRAVWLLARFLEIVDREPALKEEFGKLRDPLVDLMANHLVKKWNARGYWVDLGDEGGTYRMNNLKPPGHCISLPWEKLSIAVDGLLALYRATGDDDAMRRVVRIGTLFKHRLQRIDGRYQWYRWVPLGKWDIDPDNPAKWATWIGRSPIGEWYNVEVGIAVALYHHGVVFDRTDMDRFVKTQVGVAWNGDAENPEYLNCEGKPSDRKGQVFLCPGLAPFSEKLAGFCFTGKRRQERVDKKDNDWHGGVLASSWLWDKYVMMPAAAGGRPMYADASKRFLSGEENRALAEWLKCEVAEPGYHVPLSPTQLKDMPEAPAPKTGGEAAGSQ